jgi:alanyl-tRNA synthetase
MVDQKAKKQAGRLVSKAKNNRVFEMVSAERKELIEMASDLINNDPKLTVMLANKSGDVVGMSKTEDMSKLVHGMCKKAGGSGGGKPGFAQGKADPAKLLKIIKMKN